MRIMEFATAASGIFRNILIWPRTIQTPLPVNPFEETNPKVDVFKNLMIVETQRDSGLWKAHIETCTDLIGYPAMPAAPRFEKEELFTPRSAKDMLDALDLYFNVTAMDQNYRDGFKTGARKQLEAFVPVTQPAPSAQIS